MKRESKKPLEIIEQTETIEFELNKEKYKLTISNDLNTIEFILEELLSMNKNEYYLETNLKELQDKGDHTAVLALQEELKTLPWGEVWDEYLTRQNMVSDAKMFEEVREYEKEILSKR